MKQAWKTYKLSDITFFKNGKSRPNTQGVYPVYGGNGILGTSNQHNSSQEVVIVGRVGAYCGSVFFEDRPIWVSDNALYTLPKKNFDTKFIFYLLKNLQLNRYAEGSSHPLLTQTLLNQIEVLTTDDIEEQKQIASILSSFDEKIEINHQMNQTIEGIAQAIFTEWFIKFNFPGSSGELVDGLPKGWSRQRISEVSSNIQYGFTQSSSLENVGPKFLRITDIQGGKVNWDEVPYCKVDENELEKYKIIEHDIFIARTGASTGENIYIINPPNAVFASYLIRVQFRNPPLACYIGKYIRRQEYFNYITGIIGGSAQPNANAKQLTSFEVIIPTFDLLDTYFEIVSELNKRIVRNDAESQALAQIRDNLLPKLMLGKIEIKA